jgi:hypothetical protein
MKPLYILYFVIFVTITAKAHPYPLKHIESARYYKFNSPFSVLYNKKWKIDQMYFNQQCVRETSIYTLRYQFNYNSVFYLSDGTNTATMNWTNNPGDYSKIFIRNPETNIVEQTYNIVHLSLTHFVFTVQEIDIDTGQLVTVEYRLVPAI